MQARHRRYIARRIYLKTKAASILAQSARRALMARKRVAALRRNRAASRVAATWRGRKERRAYELLRTNAVTIQKVQRKRAAVALHAKMASDARERKVAAVARAANRSGATTVVSANPGCAMYLAAAGLDVRHPMEVLAHVLGVDGTIEEGVDGGR